ncbi:hypothetical protein V8C86DRAFT_3031786 [Haematococcus lacustris]
MGFMDEDALIEAPVHAPSVAPWHLNMSQVDNIAPARSSCHPSTWRIEHASPAPRTCVNPPAAFESTWQLEDELSMAQWPVAEHSSRRTTTDLQLAAETPLPSSQAPAPASPASPPSRQPSDQLSAHQLVELLLLQQAAGTSFPTPETTQVHPLAYPQPPTPPPHPSTLGPPLLTSLTRPAGTGREGKVVAPSPGVTAAPSACHASGRSHQVTPATPGPASSWGAADAALDSLVEQLQQLRARAAAQEQQQGRAWARVEQLEGLLAELQLLRAARQPPLLGSLTPRPELAEAEHSPAQPAPLSPPPRAPPPAAAWLTPSQPPAASHLGAPQPGCRPLPRPCAPRLPARLPGCQPLPPAGSRVVLDPALSPGQAAQVAAEVQGAGGQLVAAQHMGAGATCMVTHSADAALAWLGRGMDLLDQACGRASTCSGSLPGLPLPGCLTTSLAPIVKLEAAGGWEGAMPATAASTGGQLLPSSSKPGGGGEVDWSQLDSERGRKLLLLQLKAREEEGGATGRAAAQLHSLMKSTASASARLFGGRHLTLLLPDDERGLLGLQCLRLEGGLTHLQLLGAVHRHYSQELGAREQAQLMAQHPRLRRALQASFVAGIPVRRSQLLGARCGWDGLVRCSRDQAMAVYELQLCM